MKSIKEQMLLLKESFDAVGTKLNGLTWQRIEKSHLEFSQSQTQELQEQNRELVFVLQNIANMLEVNAKISVESIKRVLTKYNHLKQS